MSEAILVTAANLSRRCFDAKFGTMRKPQNFIVYPKGTGGNHIAIIQSNKSIGKIDLTTGRGTFYTGHTGAYSPGFIHLAMGKPFDFPADVVEKVKAILG